MKYLIFTLLSFFSILFVSCSDDESPVRSTDKTGTNLEIFDTDSTISSSDTIFNNSEFSIAFSATKGSANLISWSLSLDNVLLSGFTNIPVSNPSSFTEVVNIIAPQFSGNYLYTLSVRDEDNIIVEKSLIVIVADSPVGALVGLIATDSTVSGDVTLTVGSTFDIVVSASKGERNMATWSILRDGIALANYDRLDVPDADAFTVPITNIPVPNIAGTYEFTFQITSIDGITGSVSWVITVENAAAFSEYTNIQLGAQANASFGAFFLARQVEVSNLAQANASNGEAVEFFYYNGATNGPTLFSPSDPDAGQLYGGSVANWLIRFDTQIQKSALNYDNVTPDQVDESIVNGTKANQLQEGDVVLIKTQLGLKAILVIRSLTPGNAGSIMFDIKIVD